MEQGPNNVVHMDPGEHLALLVDQSALPSPQGLEGRSVRAVNRGQPKNLYR